MAAELGFVEGKCYKCGKNLRRKRPVNLAICDCYKYCPLCGAEMTPFTPHLTPSTYRIEESLATKGEPVESPGWTLETLYICNNHTPPYYWKQKPVEVRLS